MERMIDLLEALEVFYQDANSSRGDLDAEPEAPPQQPQGQLALPAGGSPTLVPLGNVTIQLPNLPNPSNALVLRNPVTPQQFVRLLPPNPNPDPIPTPNPRTNQCFLLVCFSIFLSAE